MVEDQPIPTAERWLPVPGYEGVYSVSDLGRVRREAGYHCRVTRLMKPVSHKGYMRVGLCRRDCPRWTEKVSRLVLLAFVGPCPDGMECLHGDGNSSNDCLDNLRWGTSMENHADMKRHGRTACGDRNGSRTHPERLPRGNQHHSRTHPERLARGNRNGTRTHPECLARGNQHHTRTHPETVARGSRNGSAKLTEEKVLLVHERLASGDSRKSIAHLLNVSMSAIDRIATGKTWKHVH